MTFLPSPIRRWSLALAVVTTAVIACGKDNVINPVPGTLKVNLTTANPGADGAVLFAISGPAAPNNVVAPLGLRAFGPTSFGTNNRFIVTGTLTNGTILTFDVPDVNATYTATLLGVAATSSYQLRGLTGYGLTVTP